MASEWEAFKNEDDNWFPGGRERLIVLEEDDVLLIPPGLRVVHAVHSPVSYLTEGGMLWDEMSVLETLHSIAWTRENGVITNKDMDHQLPRIVNNLKRLVRARTDKFTATRSSTQFLESRKCDAGFRALGVYMRTTILRSIVQMSGKRTALCCLVSASHRARNWQLHDMKIQ
ncbi:hypothetical protein LTR56_028240, partial [Elasticomyces elasticus]